MTLLVLYFVLALTVSFTCSLFESVILSVTHTYISLLRKNGRRSGDILARLKKNINHPLAVILTLNTVANVIGAAGVGAQTYQVFGSRWVALSSVILTVLILVFSEIMPKTLGAAHWKTFAPFEAYVLRGLIVILFPVVKILEGVSRFILKHGEHLNSISRDEIRMMAEIGRKEGVLRKNEARMIENVLMLSEMRTENILTPRAVLLAFHKDNTIAETVEAHSPIRFSRIPAYGDSLDDIVGIILRNELIEAYYTGRGGEAVASLVKRSMRVVVRLLDRVDVGTLRKRE